MEILILEDDNNRVRSFRQNFIGHVLTVTDNAFKCIELLKSQKWDMLFLDHDLDDQVYVNSANENTGAQVARFINANPDTKPPVVIIHSMNPAGAEYMNKQIPDSRRVVGAWLMELVYNADEV